MLTGLKLLAITVLGATYLSVAFLAAHPRVDAEYAAHFLSRTANCWLPQALRADDAPLPASVEIGQIGSPEACRYLRLNWHFPEGWGAWSGPKQATLRLPWRPDSSAVALTMRGAPAPGPSIGVQFVLNGQARIEEIPPGTSRTIVFPLPRDLERHAPDMRLTFDKHAAVPGPPPTRAARDVGIGLVAIRYLAASPGAGAEAAAAEANTAAHAPKE